MKRMETWALALVVAGMFVSNDVLAIGMFCVAGTLFGVLTYTWLSRIFARTAR